MPQHPLNIGIEVVPANVINLIAFNNAVRNNASRLTQKQLRKNQVKHKVKFYLQDTEESLRAEVANLQQKLAVVKQEKAELESLLQQQEKEKKLQLQEMQIEIDLNKLAHQVAEITQTEYFQQLQIEVKYLRNSKIS
ncbi:hypothetical protein ACN23B_14015 [Anabaena sp. FACHB-709]|uniref:Uncharacterized protein n=2 Tax=Nostocaceae TaxID=1162 RepID=A0A1Z4KHI1_ANAVA|nr:MULTISPECIES: hypothetical protein [Nostocaceae]BAY68421.1 hypothetical protein NIES23_12070 [Trichormus variabilis NIES-23]HBW32688.1 hypothetical protein [Nostoc sp. UBA8866]MBD2171769.1 hypothetical protein [Anabaena cylindrica FACHB-318]MBD2264287.1 hypothetical protein [Anabaena sp. FACHB-709]MBD2273630.1 hypothetical protein [Nostoc sp. PCC 7120 = FACHB-418]